MLYQVNNINGHAYMDNPITGTQSAKQSLRGYRKMESAIRRDGEYKECEPLPICQGTKRIGQKLKR